MIVVIKSPYFSIGQHIRTCSSAPVQSIEQLRSFVLHCLGLLSWIADEECACAMSISSGRNHPTSAIMTGPSLNPL